jgi:chromosome segregation ATPase
MEDSALGAVTGDDAIVEMSGANVPLMNVPHIMESATATITEVMEKATRLVLAVTQRDVRTKELALQDAERRYNQLALQHEGHMRDSVRKEEDKEREIANLQVRIRGFEENIKQKQSELESARRDLHELNLKATSSEEACYEAGLEAGRATGRAAAFKETTQCVDAAETGRQEEFAELDVAAMAFANASLGGDPGAPATPESSIFRTPTGMADDTPTPSPGGDPLRAQLHSRIEKAFAQLENIKREKASLVAESAKLCGDRSAMLADLAELRSSRENLRSVHAEELRGVQRQLDAARTELDGVQALAASSASASRDEVDRLKRAHQSELAATQDRLRAAEREADESRREADESRREADESRREADESRREALVTLKATLKRQRDALDEQLGDIEHELRDNEEARIGAVQAAGFEKARAGEAERGADDDEAERGADDDEAKFDEEEAKSDDRMSVVSGATGATGATKTSQIPALVEKKGEQEAVKRVQRMLGLTFPAALPKKSRAVTSDVLGDILGSHKEIVTAELSSRGHRTNSGVFETVFAVDKRIDWHAVSAAVLVRVMGETVERLPSVNELKTFWKAEAVQKAMKTWKSQYRRHVSKKVKTI